jgi:F-type H+-transporting ATPase subunit b
VFLFAEVDAYESLKALFENNLINWLILMAGVVYLWNKFVPPMFKAREESITNAIVEARAAKSQGEAMLEEQKVKIANAEQEAAKILDEAKALATQLKQQMEAQTLKDTADLKAKIEQSIANERQAAITSLRQAAARASIILTEKALPSLLDETAKARLLTQFMEQLDKEVGSDTTLKTRGSLESAQK